MEIPKPLTSLWLDYKDHNHFPIQISWINGLFSDPLQAITLFPALNISEQALPGFAEPGHQTYAMHKQLCLTIVWQPRPQLFWNSTPTAHALISTALIFSSDVNLPLFLLGRRQNRNPQTNALDLRLQILEFALQQTAPSPQKLRKRVSCKYSSWRGGSL